MDTRPSFMDLVERVLCEVAGIYRSSEPVRTLFAFDREHGQFLLVDEGWNGIERVHSVWAHLEVLADRIYVHEDGTEIGLPSLLMRSGVPKDKIVLGFYPESHRKHTEFAVA